MSLSWACLNNSKIWAKLASYFFVFVSSSDNHINLQEKEKNLSGKHEIKLKGNWWTYLPTLVVCSFWNSEDNRKSEDMVRKTFVTALESENATNFGMSVPRQRGRRVNSAFIFFLLSLVMKHWVQNIMITWTSKGSRVPNGLFLGSTKPLYFIAWSFVSKNSTTERVLPCALANARCVKNTRE